MPYTIQQLGNLSKDGVFLYSASNRVFKYVNDAFARIFRQPPEQLLQQASLVLTIIKSEDTYYLEHCLKDLEKERAIANREFRLQFPDGAITHLSVDAYLPAESGLVIGFVKDITLSKQHEDYIINYGAKKDTLLDMMSHNLAGPLSISRDILQWTQKNYKDTIPEDIRYHFQMIEENTRYCLDIINDFLKEEHLESEKIYVKKTRFDLLERIVATLDKLIATNKQKNFRLITNLENLNISTDSVKFFQIIHNLVSNAIKFTGDNGQIDIIIEEMETSFTVRVKDNGIGIPRHLHESLFIKRNPDGRKGLKNEQSTGMGLYIIKKLVELLNGRVYFESKENEGSVFSIELPKD